MYQIVTRFHFDSAHYLRCYNGKCSHLHGHRWEIEVCIEGSQLDEQGMLIDFGDVKSLLHPLTEQFDHSLINDHESFSEGKLNPTAENLAFYFFAELKKSLPLRNRCRLAWVKVYESPDSWAVYKED